MVRECVRTWQRLLLGYDIVEWIEDNCDISSNRFAAQAHKAGKWAFVSDYARLKILYDHGGIYTDTDVEIVKSLDQFLVHDAFTGFEPEKYIPNAVMGAQKGNKWIEELLSYYEGRDFVLPDGSLHTTTNVRIITDIAVARHGLCQNGQQQVLAHSAQIYPSTYFCRPGRAGNSLLVPVNCYAVHHFHGSWQSSGMNLRRKAIIGVSRVLGPRGFNAVRNLKRRVFRMVSARRD